MSYPTQPPTGTIPPPKQVKPNPNDMIEFTIKLPRYYYDTLSGFARFLYSQPQQDAKGQLVLDPKTGKQIPSLPAPNIETYFVTCAMNTFQSYQAVLEIVKQRQAQQAQQPQTGNPVV